MNLDRRTGADRRTGEEPWRGPDRRSGRDRRQPGSANEDPPRVGLGSDRRRTFNPVDGRPRQPIPIPSTREVIDGVGIVLTDIVSGFYDASMALQSWSDVLGKVKSAVHADICAIASHDFATKSGCFDQAVGLDPTYHSAYADLYSADNPWLHDRERFAAPGALWTSQELLPDAELIETDFYRYWLRPQNVFHHLFGVIECTNDRVTYIVVGRSYPKGAFWLDHAAMLSRLLPSLAHALRAGRHHHHERRLRKIAFETIDTLPIGVVLISQRGVVAAANRFARDIIDHEDVLFVGSGALGLKLPAGRVRLRDYLSARTSTPRDPTGDLLCLSIPREGRRPLTLLATSLPGTGDPSDDDAPSAVIFIGDPERPVEIDPRMLIRVYGLSRAEARVAALLATGARLDKVAEDLGLTYETVRKHLKKIFTKTSTERQAELLRTITLGPAGLLIPVSTAGPGHRPLHRPSPITRQD